ncbi:hypothetical protein B0H11DRAFT_2286723 [Mycena galericulata]|nr:hypothetical protein B0H11DRAFT_2286723 [Mycena galericulata]
MHLSIPRLETLSLSMRAISSANVLSFLKRSSPPLQRLVLGDGVKYGGIDQLVECLRLVPTVTHFELWYPETRAAGAFTFLAETPPRLLPNLRSLTIRPDSRIPISDYLWETLFCALVVRRTQIQIVHIEYESWCSASLMPASNILAAFEELAAAGMEVYFGTRTQNFLCV